MPKIGKFELDDWIIATTSVFAVVIGVLDFLGWLQISQETLNQMIIVAIGLLMASIVIQAKRQENDISQLKKQIESSLMVQLDARYFVDDEKSLEYMAEKMRSADAYIDHASVYSVPRWYKSMTEFERAYEDVAISNKVKMRYIGNFNDPARHKRVKKFLSNSGIYKFFAASIPSENLSLPMLNFMIIDGVEAIIAVPGFGENNKVISINNLEVVSAFEKYFNLLWSKAKHIEREELQRE